MPIVATKPVANAGKIGHKATIMLHIKNLTYRIGGRTLLEEASLIVPEGSKTGLVGRNGTGKTTLFKLLTGEISAEEVALPPSARARVSVRWLRKLRPRTKA